MKTKTRLRLNKIVCVDLKYFFDSEGIDTSRRLVSVCVGTMYHVACMVKNREPKHVVQCFIEVVCQKIVVVDQGSKFGCTFSQEPEGFCIDVRITGSHAGWRHGLVKRHGGSLGVHAKMVRTCSRWNEPIFYRISESYTGGGSGQLERGSGRRG